MIIQRRFFAVVALGLLALGVLTASAGEIARADLDIVGLSLEVDRQPVITAIDVPAFVQTTFGGKSNGEAPSVPGLSAIGELTGPGILTPITLATIPGQKFSLPALHEKGEYSLQNIRLTGANGEFLQQAVPSFAAITVEDALKTELHARQLTPQELRERGITIDSRNYDVFEYTIVLGVGENRVEIPYTVVVDNRSHVVDVPNNVAKYRLPPLTTRRPPRVDVPQIGHLSFAALPEEGGGGAQGGGTTASIPAAIVLPSGFGVLHQFFAVILQVSNGSSDASRIRIDSIKATIDVPQGMRTAKVVPAVTLGQPVPIHDATTGATYLVAGAQGQAEWTLEALKAGTHTMDVTVEGIYQKEGQADFPLRGHASTSIVVSDPRFQINFSHPDVVRADETYTAYAFVTNLSSQAQHVALDLAEIPACSSGGAVANVCRVDGESVSEVDIPPGEMATVPYKLTSKITGNVFAAAGSANDEAVGVSVKLTMGVSESGIPLSAATLVMPHYARYLPNEFVAANLQLLGLGYSLATAPLNQYTAKFPRLIRNDVFQRAQEIARAGERIFVTRRDPEANDPEENRDAFMQLALDLLGNIERIDQTAIVPEMTEWDDFRRLEKSGRRASAAMARQLETHGLHNGRTPQQFVDDFAAATSHRSGFLFAWAHGADVPGQERPYALSLLGVATNRRVDVPAEATSGWVRSLPFAEVTRFDSATERGEMAILGRVTENIRVLVTPQSSTFTLHIIYPDTADGAFLRTDIDITGATPGQTVWIDLARGWRTPVVNGASGIATVRDVPQTPLRVIGAAQDLHLNSSGHLVSILFNRPLYVADALTLRDRLALTTTVAKASYVSTRRYNPSDPAAELQVPSAALQEDGKLVNVTFDKTLSRNAAYTIAVDGLVDLVSRVSFADASIVPRIDNARPAGILTGRVLNADGTPVPAALVNLAVNNIPPAGPQIDLAGADGRFLFEFVERDIDRGITGMYQLAAVDGARATQVNGAVRLAGEVHTVNLVFLGRGTVRGHVLYDDGAPVANATLMIASALNRQNTPGTTDDAGFFEISGIPVGPFTIYANDNTYASRTAYAANAIRTAGEVVTQDLQIFKREYHGSGTVRLTVRRADTNAVVADANTLVQTSGYELAEGVTDSNGFIEYRNVPAGLLTILADQFEISIASYAAIETELKPDQVLEQTIVLPAPSAPQASNFIGVIKRDDPAAPGDRTRDQVVPGAIIQIGTLPSVTAAADGSYNYPNVPVGIDRAQPPVLMLVFDPATGRKGRFTLPSALEGDVHFNVLLSTTAPEGVATVRVRLTSAMGTPVPGYRVIVPGFPAEVLTEKPGGIYELSNVRVPNDLTVAAVPLNANGTYGEQMTQGFARVDFNGQVAIVDLRLPGQGTVVARAESRQPDEACAGAPPCYASAIGPAALYYSGWDELEQHAVIKKRVVDAGASQTNTFDKVPARQTVTLATEQNPAGYATAVTAIDFEGDRKEVTLRLESVGDVTGRVFAHDRQTALSGALVKLQNGAVVYGSQLTKPDGSFRFAAVPANLQFRVVAEMSRDGVYRTGSAEGQTPLRGGPVSNLVVVMREQSTIEGQVVDANGQPVPLAYFWARELWWPNREFGTAQDPLQADVNGRFILQNVFSGPFRITAKSPTVQEVRGDYQGTIAFEGDTSQQNVKVHIGSAGAGTLSISVVDSLQAFQPVPNTEVTIYRGVDPFDVGSTDDRGIVEFRDVIAGTYSVGAYSKSVGRAGRIDSLDIVANGTTTRQIVLDFLGKVSGDVADPETVPVANGPAKGVAVQVSSRFPLRETTDAEGKFSLLGVPEGPFDIFAYDFETGRMAFGPAGLFISRIVQEQNDIHLQLEKMATLHVKAYLPNDAGGAGELAPLAAISVEATDYLREQQGNDLAFPRMINRYPYRIVAKELGGEHRTVVASGSFPPNSYDYTETVVFPSSGTVEVQALDGLGQPLPDVRVLLSNLDRTVYTGADGIAVFTGVPLQPVSVIATKGAVGGSASGLLQSRSVPLRLIINLGFSATVTGFVESELGVGAPSAGTRVVLNVTSAIAPPARLETLTGPDGMFAFSGVPVGSTHLSILYYGPDDTTIGATRAVDVPNGTTGTFTVAPVKLDATPPRVVSVDPAANTNNVSPSSSVVVTFSEAIAASFLTTGNFELIATDNNTPVGIALQASLRPDGTYQVRLIPPPPPAGQRFPLKSNVTYRVVIHAGIQDSTGNTLSTTIGSTFTTVNYSEPSVVRIDPSPDQPLGASTTLRIKFNKAIDVASLDPGNGGVLTLEKLTTRGGTPVRTIPLARSADPADPTVIVAGVTGETLEEASFFRLTVSGIRDTQTPPNVQVGAKVVELFSFDTKKPLATIVSPVAAGEKLVSDIFYTARANVVDEGTGAESTDIESVDWFDGNGQFLRRVTAPPFSYSFVAPSTTTTTTFTLKVSATDLSGNSSPTQSSFTWDVIANAPPANVSVVNTPASLYPTQAGSSTVTFSDEGLQVTAALELHGKRLDGSDVVQALGSKQVSRASATDAWPAASFNYTLPLDLQPGTAQVVAKVTDLSKTGTGQAALEILNDAIAPQVISFLPAPETHYTFDSTYTIELQVRDDETGIKNVVLSIAGVDVPAAQVTHTVASGVHTYRTTARVPAKNADTRIAIVAKAYDNRDNVSTSTSEVVYERVDDQSIPVAAWVTPLDQAAIPFGIAGWQATLRIRATDDSQVTSVEFASSAFAAPVAAVTAPKNGTTDIFEAKATFNMPANGAPFVVTALVHDADPNHTVELPITLHPVSVDPGTPAITASSSISSLTAAQYDNKTVVALGGGVRLTITVPLRVKNLLVLDGASVSTFEETTLDLTVADHVFIDADSSLDVSDKGYLGAHRVREDNALRNDTNTGRTIGANAGAANDASGSYAGVGGEAAASLTNATYGSIAAPRDFGSGGAGSSAAGNGGGAAILSAGTARFVVAGIIAANGGTGVSRAAAGSGGSLAIDAHTLITGPATSISANGGDDDSSSTGSNGGGGGRIALRVTNRLDAPDLSRLSAHGGRNGTDDGAQFIDGGAGTILLVRPNATSGELIVSSFDARQPASTHRTRGTPLSGALDFDSITIGPRALARFDVAHTVPLTVDPTAAVVEPADVPRVSIVSTIPDSGSQIAQSTSVTPSFTADSASGITRARIILGAQPTDTIVNFASVPASVSESQSSIIVPATATAGATTLRVAVTDRAGRVAESAAIPFTVVTNAAPVIDTFNVTPADQIYAGGTIAVSAAASDDIEVKSLSLAASTGTVTAQPATKPSPQTMARAFTVAVPKTAAGGTNVVLTLSASDDFPNRVPTAAQHTVSVLHDTAAPAVTITQPSANQMFDEIANGTFALEVTALDAEAGVNTVKATFEGVEYTLQPVAGQPGRFRYANLPIPAVDGTEPVAKTITVTVTDFEPNVTTASVTILVRPLTDPNAPTLRWVCSSPNAMYPPGYAVPLRIFAEGSSAQNGVSRVELSINGGAPSVVNETAAGSKEYATTFTIPPATPAGTVFNVRFSATSTSNNDAALLGTFTTVTGFDINTDSEIAANDLAFENLSLIVRAGGALTITGPHTFANLVVLAGGKLVQKHLDVAKADQLTVDALFVACGGSIDVTAKGFGPHTTYPGARPAGPNGGGSHIGLGGIFGDAGTSYGSIYRPREAGAGEYNRASGGGVVRIAAARATIDGTIVANGETNPVWFEGGAAGGSVWIAAQSVRGGGVIEVNGGDGAAYWSSNGAAGAIAIEYTDPASTLPRLNARSGNHYNPHAGAGSIYTKGPGSLYGSLRFDNTGILMERETALPALGTWTVASVPSPGRVVLAAPAEVPPYFEGHWLRVQAPDGTIRGLWRIASVATPVQLELEPGAEPFDVRAGDTVRGAYRLDSLTLVNAWVETPELVLVESVPNLDATSRLTTGNDSAPAIDPALMSFEMGIYGPVLRGQPGAVADPDAPIAVSSREYGPSDMIASGLTFGTVGGFSVRKLVSDGSSTSATAKRASTLAGYISCRTSQTNAHFDCGISGNGREYSFGVLEDGTWQVSTNGGYASMEGTYTTNTTFRVERSAGTARWYVDGTKVHEVAVDATALTPYVALLTAGEINSIHFSSDSTEPLSAIASSDGSFLLGVEGGSGDPVRLEALDSHRWPLSSAKSLQIPGDVGIASASFESGSTTGGRSITASVTLGRPAGAGGVIVQLSSDSPKLVLPATVTIPAGAASASFSALTSAVVSATNVSMIATWGNRPLPPVSLTLVPDLVAPVVTVSAPSAGSQFTEGAGAGIPVEVTVVEEDSGVAAVTATVDANSASLTRNVAAGPNIWTGTLAVPSVDGSSPVSKTITVTATDNGSNRGSATVDITVNPLIDSSLPTLYWSCFGSGGMYATGEPITFFVSAAPPNETNVIQSVSFIVTDPTNGNTTLPAISQGSDGYSATYVVPAVADGSSFSVRARVLTVSGTFAEETRTFTAVADPVRIDGNLWIDEQTTEFENKTVLIAPGVTVLMSGHHNFKRLIVSAGATLTHPQHGRIDIETTDGLFVACGGLIDVRGRGYLPHESYPGVPIASSSTGGSHIGVGGDATLGSSFGSVYRPSEGGGGGSQYGSGGGVVRIVTSSLVNDGVITASGATDNRAGGGGGSVWITASTISGEGSIGAAGGNSSGFNASSGGGGAVTVEYTTANPGALANILAPGGPTIARGGAGTVLLKSAAQMFGDLTIDNRQSGISRTELPALGNGVALNASGGSILMTDRQTPAPQYFEGHWVEIASPDGTRKGLWRIGHVDGITLTLLPNGTETLDIAAGDLWRGVYRFDNLKLRQTMLFSSDEILVSNPIDKDDESLYNEDAPVFPFAKRSEIVVQTASSGDAVVAPAGAVTDPDTPIKIVATNTRTSEAFTVNASADGSFRIPVVGEAGDTFTLKATDSHPLPRTSSVISANGAISDIGLQTLNVNPSEVLGSRVAVGAVTLAAAAEGAGAVVVLESDDSAASVPANVTVPAGQNSATFPVVTQPVPNDRDVAITATYRGRKTASLRVLHDGVAPSVTISQPVAGSQYLEGSPISVEATVIDDVGVAEVSASVTGATAPLSRNIALGPNVYSGTINAPFIEGTTDLTRSVTVTARDFGNNTTSASVSVLVTQSATGVVLTGACLSEGGMYAIGDAVPLRVSARAAEGATIQSVEFIITDPDNVATTLPAAAVGGGDYEVLYTVPPVPDGASFQVRVKAIASTGASDELTGSFLAIDDVVKFAGSVNIFAWNTAYEGRSVVVESGTTTIGGEHHFKRLVVYPGATVVAASQMPMTVRAENVFVACGASIDAIGTGFLEGMTADESRSYPDTAGSHIGTGTDVHHGSTYGSVEQPKSLGAGGSPGGQGGGAIRIDTGALTVHGSIRANGESSASSSSSTGGGGGGGSIWISASTLSGSGSLEANGGDGCIGGGGGGAIAVEYSSDSPSVPAMVANGGRASSECSGALLGGAGSIFVRGPHSVFGSLTIESPTPTDGMTELPGIGGGIAAPGTSGASILSETPLRGSFLGHWIEVTNAQGTVKGTCRVASYGPGSLTLEANGAVVPDVIPGDTFRGLYRLDALRLRNANVASADLVETTSTADIDGQSSLIINDGTPVFPVATRPSILIENIDAGTVVSGPPGAVVDADGPIELKVTNEQNQWANSTGTANPDGSFRVGISGNPGDTFTITAIDAYGLSSPAIPVNGSIIETNTIANFTISPYRMNGAGTAIATVRLSQPAAGAVTLSVSSSSFTAVVPNTVVVPNGSTWVQFPIVITPMGSDDEPEITVTLFASHATQSISVGPGNVTVEELILPATIASGTQAFGTVVLSEAATSDIVIPMHTESSFLWADDAVIPAGEVSGEFSLFAEPVGRPTHVTVATESTPSRSADVTLVACAAMPEVWVADDPSATDSWVDDELPAGASGTGEAVFSTTQAAHGTKSLYFAPPTTAQIRRFKISGLTESRQNRDLVLYALVNPCDPPRQILVTWSDGTTSYRASWGESRIDASLEQVHLGAVPRYSAWTRFSTRGLPALDSITSIEISVDGGEAWFDLIGSLECQTSAEWNDGAPLEKIWFDHELPAGATEIAPFSWDASKPAADGEPTLLVTSESSFRNATDGLPLDADDMILVDALLDPCDPPREILLEWDDGGAVSRGAFWGEDLIARASEKHSIQHLRIGEIPIAGYQVTLAIPAAALQLSGTTLRSMSFAVSNGRAWFHHFGKSSRVNLALNKPAAQSSTLQNDSATYGAARAVDGTVDAASFSSTAADPHSWWQVDLGVVQPIDSIDVWNVAQCCQQRLANFYVLVSDEPFASTDLNATLAQSGVSAFYQVAPADRPTSFRIERTGRFVRVQLVDQNNLNLSEVHVFAPILGPPVNLAGGRQATQSSTASGSNGPRIAALAVNGNATGESYSQTASDSEAWWEVDMGRLEEIDTIDIDNAFGPELSRLSNFYLFVSDEPFTSNTVAGTLAQPGVAAYYRATPASAFTFPIRRMGRYVRLQLTGNGILQPMELRAGSAVRTLDPLAKGAPRE